MSGHTPNDRRLMDAAVDSTASGPEKKGLFSKTELSTVDCDILILEDEVLMQALLNRYISTFIAGKPKLSQFKVKTLSSGWDLIQADLSKVKVAIVDILLPQVTGVDLIRGFRARFPNLGIVPISGMATEPMKRALKDLLAPGTELLQKPLRKDEFLEAFEKACFYKQPPTPSANPPEEGVEQLWTTVDTNTNRIEIPTIRRKLLRKKAA